jgi:hypothetical protein
VFFINAAPPNGVSYQSTTSPLCTVTVNAGVGWLSQITLSPPPIGAFILGQLQSGAATVSVTWQPSGVVTIIEILAVADAMLLIIKLLPNSF